MASALPLARLPLQRRASNNQYELARYYDLCVIAANVSDVVLKEGVYCEMGASNRRKNSAALVSGSKPPTGQKYRNRTKKHRKPNLARSQQPMGVRDASGRDMTEWRFTVTEALLLSVIETQLWR